MNNFYALIGVVTGVKFGQNASFLASVGMDRSLKYYGIRD